MFFHRLLGSLPTVPRRIVGEHPALRKLPRWLAKVFGISKSGNAEVECVENCSKETECKLTACAEHGAVLARPMRTGHARVTIADSLMRTILLICLVVRIESPGANRGPVASSLRVFILNPPISGRRGHYGLAY